MATTVDKVKRANPEVQHRFARLLSRLRKRNIPNWKTYISAAQEGRDGTSRAGLIRIRNAALKNLGRVSEFLGQGGRVKPGDWKELERDIRLVISSVTELMENLGSEGRTADEDLPWSDQPLPEVTRLDPRDRLTRIELGIDIEPDKDLV